MIVAIYKPKGPTSHDVVDSLRKITGEERIGHAGTLDPLASGVLVVGIGKDSTKKLSAEVRKEKEYIASIMLGERSTTDDEEGEKTVVQVAMYPDLAAIKDVVRTFEGVTEQTPPVYSAVKIQGKPAYQRVRSGETVNLKARNVDIKKIEILKYEWPVIELRVVTGPGVYIRALARDIGEMLGTGGYLSELERTRVGNYLQENTLTLEEFKKRFT